MAFRAIYFGLILALCNAGCGTVANLAHSNAEEGGRSPFGGVRHDVAGIEKALNGESRASLDPLSDSDEYPRYGLLLACGVDLPFSVLGDTLTWPYTAAYSYVNQPVPVPPMTQAPTVYQTQTRTPELLSQPTKLP
jgi:uncharacterized protein YceK